MKQKTVQKATLYLLMAISLVAAVSTAHAGMTERIAVIRIKAIDGLDPADATVQVKLADQFVVGSRVRVSRSALSSLEGVQTLVLIDRRTDSRSGESVLQSHKGEVLAVRGDAFTVKGLDGQDLSYVVDTLSDGSVDLIGPGDRIVARSGGVFKIWKIESASLVSRDRISLY